MREILVTKLDGTREAFSPAKLRASMMRAGAEAKTADDIAAHIASEVKDGMTTSYIYAHARELLKRRSDAPVAARYSMRRAVFGMGPSGFPFEKFLGEIFRARGYEAEVGVILQGRCVSHEIDVVAKNSNELILVEAKFHNQPGFKTDVKVALAVYARFLDLEAAGFAGLLPPGGSAKPLLMTNTKFTGQAIAYGECVGLTLIGWGYPKHGNVLDLIEKSRLHPLSCLTTLTQKEKEALYMQGAVLCRSITDDPGILEKAGVAGAKVSKVLGEAERLCKL